MAWTDAEGAGDVWLQRLSGGGIAPAWPADGRVVANGPGAQDQAALVDDGLGGSLVCWRDARAGNTDIYATHLGADGLPATDWPVNGFALCNQASPQTSPVLAVTGTGQAIVAWLDARSGQHKPYAMRVALPPPPTGVGGGAAVALALMSTRPNPSRGAFSVRFTLADDAAATLDVLDVTGRLVAHHDVGALGAGVHAVALGGERRLAPGVYLVRLASARQSRVTRAVVLQ